MKSSYKAFLLSFVLLTCFLMTGCGSDTIDLSSDKAYSESIKKIYEAVPEGEREEFRTNFGAVLSEIKGMGSGKINERDLLSLYDFVKAFGGEDGIKLLQPINGLTAAEITKRGRDIRRKEVEQTLKALKDDLAETEKKVEADKRIETERQKVDIACTGVEAIEAVDYKNKPLGVVGFLVADITIKNNSSILVKRVDGDIAYLDTTGAELIKVALRGYLKPADMPREESFYTDMDIAPGAEWKGKAYMRYANPQKKNHPFPVPAGKKYQASLTDLKVILADDSPADIERRAKWLKRLQDSIKDSEAELAKLK